MRFRSATTCRTRCMQLPIRRTRHGGWAPRLFISLASQSHGRQQARTGAEGVLRGDKHSKPPCGIGMRLVTRPHNTNASSKPSLPLEEDLEVAAREQVGGAVAATSPARLGCLVGLWGMRRMLVCSSCALIAHGTRSLWTSRNAKAASALTLAHMWHFPVGRHGYWFPGLESAHPALFEHGEITDLRLENCAKTL
jgi:hypothetical protein